jgi:methionyl-tRNA formyltransferase
MALRFGGLPEAVQSLQYADGAATIVSTLNLKIKLIMAKILLAGEGWGATAAFNSLKQTKEHELFILTGDEAWKTRLPDEGFKLATGFDEGFDLAITAGWRPLIQGNILQTLRILNIHYSLLPAYRGFHTTVWAILNNEPMLGFTIHRINQFVDDGPIVYQYKEPNNFIDSASYYMNRFNTKTEEVLLDVVNDYIRGNIPEIAQDKSKASWVGRRKLSHCAINFTRSIAYQKVFFRALTSPYPLPWFSIKGEVFEVQDAGFHHSPVVTDRGRILNIDHEGVWISCEGGYIICKRISLRADHKEVPHSHFKIGQMLAGSVKM